MTTMKINFSIAAAAIASPWWLTLTHASTVAAVLLPIFGLALAVLQIVRLIANWRSKP